MLSVRGQDKIKQTNANMTEIGILPSDEALCLLYPRQPPSLIEHDYVALSLHYASAAGTI